MVVPEAHSIEDGKCLNSVHMKTRTDNLAAFYMDSSIATFLGDFCRIEEGALIIKNV